MRAAPASPTKESETTMATSDEPKPILRYNLAAAMTQRTGKAAPESKRYSLNDAMRRMTGDGK